MQKPSRIKVIDALRGIAALIVVFHHLLVRFPSAFARLETSAVFPLFTFISDRNVEAVLFFFVISGFSVRLSLREQSLTSKQAVNDYLYRRFKRILPLYLITLLGSLLLGVLAQRTHLPDYSWQALAGNLLFLQSPQSVKGNWFVPYAENGVLWSLSFEMFFYLFYPGFCWLLAKVRSTPAKSLAFSFGLAWFFSALGVATNQKWPNPLSLFLSLYVIWYLGVLLAEAYLNRARNLKIALAPAFFVLIIIVAKAFLQATVLYSWLVGGAIFLVTYLYYCLKPYLWRYAVRLEETVSFLFYRIGLSSYALYLIHFPILFHLQQALSPTLAIPTLWLILLPLTLSIVALSYFLDKATQKPSYSFLKLAYLC